MVQSIQNSSINRGGRPVGTRNTETSDLTARVRAASGCCQEDFARMIGVRERTVRNYEKQSIIPKTGAVRDAIEKLARQYSVSIDESEVPV